MTVDINYFSQKHVITLISRLKMRPIKYKIDNRADFFGMNHYYYDELGIPIKWFGVAEEVSRGFMTGLGADGNSSYLTFGMSKILGNPDIYGWRSEAGNTLMQGGFDNFSGLYNGYFSGR